jgi:hypothetical protein
MAESESKTSGIFIDRFPDKQNKFNFIDDDFGIGLFPAHYPNPNAGPFTGLYFFPFNCSSHQINLHPTKKRICKNIWRFRKVKYI